MKNNKATNLMGIPVRVKDYNRVSGLQVQPKATGSSGEHEEEVLRIGGIVHLERCTVLGNSLIRQNLKKLSAFVWLCTAV